MNFYELQEPTCWATPPSLWSSTTLDDVEACPRRWQLLHSRWNGFERFPDFLHPAAIEGQIVHEALDRLTRACGQRGNPEFGSSEFLAALADANFFPSFAQAIMEWQQQFTRHPRPTFTTTLKLRVSSEELANRAVRMFREQYKPNGRVASRHAERSTNTVANLTELLKQKRALSEVRLVHPKLPFLGILDRIQYTNNEIEIIDFKTGKPSDKHRRQLFRCALLWWRDTGEAPVRVSAQYLDGVESWSVAPALLEEFETELMEKLPLLIDALGIRPAEAKLGLHCNTCAVRAHCAEGWAACEETMLIDGRGDAELVVNAKVGAHGFLARLRNGAEVAVVYEASFAKLLPEHIEGRVLRILNGIWKDNQTQFECNEWTRVLILNDDMMA